MLSRSKGRHKTSFQQLSLSINPKVTKNIIIGIGLVSSLTAFLMILEFMGLNPDYQKVLSISNLAASEAYASIADSLAGFVHGLAEKLASV